MESSFANQNMSKIFCKSTIWKTIAIVTATKLDQDKFGKKVDISSYRGMIGSLLYLTASRLNIKFATYLCARFQIDPKESHLITVKRFLDILRAYQI